MVTDIQNALLEVSPSASFIHGRSFDSALDTHINDTTVAYVYLDPIIKRGTISNRRQTLDISLGFIKQDSPDSSVEEMKAIVEEMETLALDFLRYFFDLDVLSDGSIIEFDEYSITPVYRLKNMCTGVLVTFTVNQSIPC